jgi:hypothetical protein
MISTFSVNKNFGLAVAPGKELIVKNEFFMKMILPYSVRFNEIFRLDILLYNYVETKSQLKVRVNIYNKVKNVEQFEFIEYQGNQPIVSNSSKMTNSATVLHSNLKKVSFFIRPRVNKLHNPGYVQIYAFGEAVEKSGTIHKDKLRKNLRVEAAGVKIYDIRNKIYELDGSRDQHHEISSGNIEELTLDSAGFPKISMAVAGDFLTDTINMDTRFEYV